MSGASLSIPIGVVVERRKADSQWADLLWRPIAVLAGLPDAAAWTVLSQEGDIVTYYAGPAEIVLHRSEAENYRRNLASGAPSVWVALTASEGAQPYEVAAVTADPAEGEGLTEPGQAIVEAVPMPESVRDTVAGFAAQFPADPGFSKRQRDRADPQAMARRRQGFGKPE